MTRFRQLRVEAAVSALGEDALKSTARAGLSSTWPE
jgi:hypothetical protein